MKYIILSALFLIFATSCGSKVSKEEQTASDSIVFTEVIMPTAKTAQQKFDTLKLGRLYEGEKSEMKFTLKNTGAKPLVIISVVTGCGCTNAIYSKSPISPNESRLFTITFDSEGRSGTQFKTIEIIDSDYQIAKIYLSANVISR